MLLMSEALCVTRIGWNQVHLTNTAKLYNPLNVISKNLLLQEYI
jgi:hypothetical protein